MATEAGKGFNAKEFGLDPTGSEESETGPRKKCHHQSGVLERSHQLWRGYGGRRPAMAWQEGLRDSLTGTGTG